LPLDQPCRDQNDVDFFWRVACAAEAARQAAECSPTHRVPIYYLTLSVILNPGPKTPCAQAMI
jgi:hypothetical protein